MTREENIRAILECNFAGFKDEIIDNAVKRICEIEPTIKTGHWDKGYLLPDGEYWKCTKCKELLKVKYPMKYCNNCGSKNE